MRIAVLAATLAAAVTLAVPAAAGTRTKTIKIGDDWFVRPGGGTVTVKKGTKVTWRWAGKDMHNIAVTKGPVKFRSSFKTSGTFSKKLTRTGTYTLVCTIHQPDMKMKLKVTR